MPNDFKIAARPDFSLYGGAESLTEGRPPTPTSAAPTKITVTTGRGPRRTALVRPTAGDDGTVGALGAPKDPADFLWLMTEEPHRTRRQAILKAHPEVTKLMGHEPRTKYVVALVVGAQLAAAYLLRDTPFFSWRFWAVAYVLGGTANQNLFLAIHEITHNLAFKGVKKNKALAIVANLPIAVPYAAAFKKYHIEHHKHMGEEGIDTDLPTRLELLCLNNVLGKCFFATFQIFFYALRPTFVRRQELTIWHAANALTQIAFDVVVVRTLGWTALLYLLLSSFLAGSLHPTAGHFIAEHYLWDGLAQETYSYYGALNALAYNVGYHNEHHDFPSVPWTRLPQLRKLAPEFYDTLPSHPSWVMVIVNFIRDADVGLHARAKRLAKPSVAMRAKDE